MSNTPSSRRRGHSRQRSDISARGPDPYGRPTSRHRHAESSFSIQSMTSPNVPQGSEQSQQGPAEPRHHSGGGSHPLSSLLEQSDTRPQSQAQPQFSSQAQQTQRNDPQYSAGSEMRQEGRRTTPEEDSSRQPNVIKRDAGRD